MATCQHRGGDPLACQLLHFLAALAVATLAQGQAFLGLETCPRRG